MTDALPIIGLNTDVSNARKPPEGSLSVPLAYVDAIRRGGGIPVIVPPWEDKASLDAALERLHGFCFIGGPDYNPAHYGGRKQRVGELMETRRERFDLRLGRRLLRQTEMPVLGICGGCQLINLALGGALVQDLATEWAPVKPAKETLPHAGEKRSGRMLHDFRHTVRVEPGSLIARAGGGGETIEANSYHHQAVRPDRMGKGLRATAWALDGVVEAIEAEPGSALAQGARFVLGVQWHPERMPGEEASRGIFRALADAARARRA